MFKPRERGWFCSIHLVASSWSLPPTQVQDVAQIEWTSVEQMVIWQEDNRTLTKSYNRKRGKKKEKKI